MSQPKPDRWERLNERTRLIARKLSAGALLDSKLGRKPKPTPKQPKSKKARLQSYEKLRLFLDAHWEWAEDGLPPLKTSTRADVFRLCSELGVYVGHDVEYFGKLLGRLGFRFEAATKPTPRTK